MQSHILNCTLNTPKSSGIETPRASSVSIHSCENGGGILKGIADRLGRKKDWRKGRGGKLKVSRPLTEVRTAVEEEEKEEGRRGRGLPALCSMK